MANSVSALLVAFMFANSYEPSSLRSSKPPASITFALPDKSVSHAISMDCRAVALEEVLSTVEQVSSCETYQAPTGILIGPLDDSRSKLIQPAVVLMNLNSTVSVKSK